MKTLLSQFAIVVFILFIVGCEQAADTASSLTNAVKETVGGDKHSETPAQLDPNQPNDKLDRAANGITQLTQDVSGLLGGTDTPDGSSESQLPRYQWKANRRGREQARMLATSSTSKDQLKQAAFRLVTQLGGNHWIVAFYSDVSNIEQWPSRSAVDRKLDDYLGCVLLDAGRPPKIRFLPPASTPDPESQSALPSSLTEKDAQHADMLLRSAKRLISANKNSAAELQLQAIVRKYADTSAGSEALSMLAKLKQ